jgi:hypothetical protein
MIVEDTVSQPKLPEPAVEAIKEPKKAPVKKLQLPEAPVQAPQPVALASGTYRKDN